MALLRVWLLTVAALAILANRPLPAAPPDPHTLANRIDERLGARWKRDGITPAPRADDAEFLRRASLDITGRIPPAADVYEFLSDPAADKRIRLIDRLLGEPRFAIH